MGEIKLLANRVSWWGEEPLPETGRANCPTILVDFSDGLFDGRFKGAGVGGCVVPSTPHLGAINLRRHPGGGEWRHATNTIGIRVVCALRGVALDTLTQVDRIIDRDYVCLPLFDVSCTAV